MGIISKSTRNANKYAVYVPTAPKHLAYDIKHFLHFKILNFRITYFIL